MKLFVLKLTTLLILPFLSFSQITGSDLKKALQAVLSDYSNHFSNIRGEVLHENPQTIEYATLLDFRSAEENTVIRYISKKQVYSWQAVMLTTEDFEEARKKYKWLFGQLRAMTITMNNGYSYTLSGEYEEPRESLKFSGCVFRLTPAAIDLPRVKIEITMQYTFPEWKVGLAVYEKEREDADRGEIYERGY